MTASISTAFKAALAGVAIVLGAVASTGAEAAVTVTVRQVGADVVLNGYGTLNLTGLTARLQSTSDDSALIVTPAFVGMGAPAGIALTGYIGGTGPTNFGSGTDLTGLVRSTSRFGDPFALNSKGLNGALVVYLADNYVSGAILRTGATVANNTLGSIGLLDGTYVYTLPSDTVTVIIGTGTPAVPEPATWAMMMGGFGMIGAAMRRRRRAIGLA